MPSRKGFYLSFRMLEADIGKNEGKRDASVF